MKFLHEKTLRDYMASGDETAGELLAGAHELVAALEEADRFFTHALWSGEPDLSPVAAVLSMNAFMYLLGGIRMALCGHEAAIYPLARTALESACYAYRVVQEKDLEDVWLGRHRDDSSRRACRRAFGSAVAQTAKSVGQTQADYEELINGSYEAAIDFGGHPNLKGVLGHVDFKEDDGSNYQKVEFATLYPADSWHTKRGLLACLDYAVIIGIILVHSLPQPSEEAATALTRLNEMKNNAADALNASADEG